MPTLISNSFFLVLNRDPDQNEFSDLDFAHLPDFRRKRVFCRSITKHRDQREVARFHYLDDDASGSREPLMEGVLLSAGWARCLLIHGERRLIAARRPPQGP